MDRRRKGAGSVEVKDGSWSLRYLNPKTLKRTREALGRVTDMTEDEAQRAADDFMFRLNGAAPGALTLAQLAGLYEPVARGHLARNTVDTRMGAYRAAARHFGDRPVGSIDVAAAQDYVPVLRARLHSNTVGLHVGHLALLWKFAEERHLCRDNPWRRVSVPRFVEFSVPQITLEDVERAAALMPSELERLVVLFLDATGLRYGEVMALRWDDVRTGRLVVHPGKTGRGRRFVLPALAAALVKKIKVASGGSERLFDGLPHHKTVLAHLHKACEQAGLPRLRLHDLRHHCFDDAAAAGVGQADIAAMAGHRSLRTTERYTRNHPDAAADRAVARLDAHRARAVRKAQ